MITLEIMPRMSVRFAGGMIGKFVATGEHARIIAIWTIRPVLTVAQGIGLTTGLNN